jgi:porphobilinogen synthase
MQYPAYRPRRLRQNENFRRLIREANLSVNNLIAPYFVKEGKNLKIPISSMPGQFQFSLDNLIAEIKEVKDLGIPAVLLFGIPSKKDNLATQAYAEDGIIQKAVRKIKQAVADILIITDVCLCEYTNHGHCGVLKTRYAIRDTRYGADVDNDATLELLAKAALSHVTAGADMVAPSAMMDGQVKAIRETLDKNGFLNTPIMAYSVKFASSFYGPFRQAAESPPQFGDRKSYQMDMANSNEALREISLDIQEGADIIMVKPALAYLDIIRRVKEKFNLPLAAYNVSAEYALVKAAAQLGWIDEKKIIMEILTSIKRAGADIVITYHAKEIVKSGLLNL